MEVKEMLRDFGAPFYTYKDQVIFERNEVVKNDGKPYTVFTPFKNRWLLHFNEKPCEVNTESAFTNLKKSNYLFPKIGDLGFSPSKIHESIFACEWV